MWIKLDDQFADHPKVLRAGPLATLLHIKALCYAARYLTDGYIPGPAAQTLVNWDDVLVPTDNACPGAYGEREGRAVNGYDLALDLVKAGLWEEADGGWRIHDYLELNPSAEQVRSERERERQKKAYWRSGQGRDAHGRITSSSACPDSVPLVVPGGVPTVSASVSVREERNPEEGLNPSAEEVRASRKIELNKNEELSFVPKGLPKGVPKGQNRDTRACPANVPPVPVPVPVPLRDPEKEGRRSEKPTAPLLLSDPPKSSPLSFGVDEAQRLLAVASGGRFVASRLKKGPSIAVVALIRANPDRQTWQLVGEWLKAGGDAWKQTVDVRALGDFEAWVAHANRWEKDGRPSLAKRNGSNGKPEQKARELPDVRDVLREFFPPEGG